MVSAILDSLSLIVSVESFSLSEATSLKLTNFSLLSCSSESTFWLLVDESELVSILSFRISLAIRIKCPVISIVGNISVSLALSLLPDNLDSSSLRFSFERSSL